MAFAMNNKQGVKKLIHWILYVFIENSLSTNIFKLYTTTLFIGLSMYIFLYFKKR